MSRTRPPYIGLAHEMGHLTTSFSDYRQYHNNPNLRNLRFHNNKYYILDLEELSVLKFENRIRGDFGLTSLIIPLNGTGIVK
jgi:hypothetical protein